ncbi:MAG: hypothetical protein Q7S56_03310 [Nanoarchaeota archaeon]|nr:hypothetical protein [Nanoarchaeota archaeon]
MKSIDKILCLFPFNPQLEYKTADVISGGIDAFKMIGMITIGLGLFGKEELQGMNTILTGMGVYGASVIIDYVAQRISDKKFYSDH